MVRFTASLQILLNAWISARVSGAAKDRQIQPAMQYHGLLSLLASCRALAMVGMNCEVIHIASQPACMQGFSRSAGSRVGVRVQGMALCMNRHLCSPGLLGEECRKVLTQRTADVLQKGMPLCRLSALCEGCAGERPILGQVGHLPAGHLLGRL